MTSWLSRLSGRRNTIRWIILATTTSFCIFFLLVSSNNTGNARRALDLFYDTVDAGQSLPREYESASDDTTTTPSCTKRHGIDYIRGFRNSATEYCDANSTASLMCFSYKAHDLRTDSFCAGTPATYRPSTNRFLLDCRLREANEDDRHNIAHPLANFPPYWSNTGPIAVLRQHVDLDLPDDSGPMRDHLEDRTLFMIQREHSIDNLWHTLMQVMSLSLSLDVLRSTLKPGTSEAMFTTRDMKRSQVVILDAYEDGPFYDLWTMYTDLPPVRLSDIAHTVVGKMVIPLPGGSNPIWEGDWVDLPCNQSVLLKMFSQRVLDFYKVRTDSTKHTSLTLTMIDRKTTRILSNQDSLFSALQARFPDVTMRLVDFSQLPFREQLQVAHSSDILVGVHGAGLTHAMFLKPSSSIVEILPPTLAYKGFKNMARLCGLSYFSRHGPEHEYSGKTGEWHHDEVSIEEDRFMEVMMETVANTRARKSSVQIA
ncbi:hypothetical protein LTR42_001885 [Elasticomyces elasticus]|nr:hypothetical protein LTR42_001885 [Elasticomyces elasticus]